MTTMVEDESGGICDCVQKSWRTEILAYRNPGVQKSWRTEILARC
jgi:hypothetical protein